MVWAVEQALGVAEMDDTHQAFVALVDALLVTVDADFPPLSARLREHTLHHFERPLPSGRRLLSPAGRWRVRVAQSWPGRAPARP